MALQDLKDGIDGEIENDLDELIDYPKQRDDKVSEIADNWVPDNYRELAELLVEDHSFAQVDDYGMLQENPTVWDIITASVREHLVAYAHKEAKRQIDDFEELKSDLEIDGFQVSKGMRGKYNNCYYVYRDYNDDDVPAKTSIDTNGTVSQYDNEQLIQADFKTEVEAWKWLEKNLEEVQAKLGAAK